MDSKELRLTVKFGDDGQLYINNMTALTFFGSKNKSTSAIVEITILSDDASQAMITYYKKFIVPEFRKAIRENGENLTLEKTEDYLAEITPMLRKETWCDDAKSWIPEYIKFEDLNNHEGSECITYLKQLAAMEFSFNIDDGMYTEK